MENLRVLVVTPFLPPGVGGSTRLVRDIVERLHEDGAGIHVLAMGDRSDPRVAEVDSSKPYRIRRIGYSKFPGGSTIQMLARTLSAVSRGSFDVILCGSAQPVIYPVYAAHRLFGTPYVVMTYGEDLVDVREQSLKHRLLSRALRSASRLLPISVHTRSCLKALGAPEDRIDIVSPGIDPAPYLDVTDSAAGALKSKLGLDGKRIVLTLARLDVRKGHDTVVRALPAIAKEVPDTHYLIVGMGDPSRILRIAGECGVRDRVTIVDYVADAELPTLFRMADVTVMLSRKDPDTGAFEGFGICYLEAAACGRPAIAANVGGATDAVVDGETGYVVGPLDSDGLAARLIQLLRDDILAERLGAAGRARVIERFTKSHMLERYTSVLIAAAERSRKPN